VANAEKLLGVTEKDPIDFYVYADQAAFYAALGPGTPENVGGEAHADIRTMFALITPGQVDQAWVKEVVPHELTHLVFNTAVDNPYHAPPRWLNEGLAVYLSRGYTSSDRSEVEAAGAAGTLAPLASLGGAFPNGDRFFLAYAESVSAVDYLVKTYGKPDLVKLIRSYAQGLTDDEAFKAALGVDVATFDAAWRKALDAKPMASTGPRPAPAGPLPSDWTGPGPGAGSAPPAAIADASASSVAAAVTASPAPTGVDRVPVNTGVPLGLTLVVVALGALVLVVVVVLFIATGKRGTPGPGTPGPGTPGPGTLG
jgi:peptidase MA superfamily protein